MIGESILELHETNATDETIKSYQCNEYQPITGTQLNSASFLKKILNNIFEKYNIYIQQVNRLANMTFKNKSTLTTPSSGSPRHNDNREPEDTPSPY